METPPIRPGTTATGTSTTPTTRAKSRAIAKARVAKAKAEVAAGVAAAAVVDAAVATANVATSRVMTSPVATSPARTSRGMIALAARTKTETSLPVKTPRGASARGVVGGSPPAVVDRVMPSVEASPEAEVAPEEGVAVILPDKAVSAAAAAIAMSARPVIETRIGRGPARSAMEARETSRPVA